MLWSFASDARLHGGRLIGLGGAVLLVLFWAVTASRAQHPVDWRVDMSVRQDGRLFDANPRLGGVRYNYARPLSPLVGGNAFASGLVGGGLSLRSFSPIADPTAFRASLGSGALAAFRRDSVSVSTAGDRLAGWGFAQPYYDPATTVGTAGFLQGLTAPSDVRTGSPKPLDLRIPQRVDLLAHGRYNPPVAPGSVPEPESAARATLSSIFGLEPPPLPLPLDTEPPDAWRREPGSETVDTWWRRPRGETLQRGPERAAAGAQDTPAARMFRDRSLPDPAEALATPLDVMLRSDRYPRPGLIEPGSKEPPPWAGGVRGGVLRPGLIVPPPVEEGQEPAVAKLPEPGPTDASLLPGFDVFTDMRLALALSEDPGAAWFREMLEQVRSQPDPQREIERELARDSQEFVDRMLNTPLETFTGSGASAVNDHMLKAEALLEIGHYAEAAERYHAAHVLDPANPLPLLGKGHALLASGDYRSAAYALIQGLERFPEMARFSIDLARLMGGGEIVDIRRADIMKRLEQRESTELRFLLGYLEYHGGNREAGLANLDRAAWADRSGSIITRYPAMLRGEGLLPLPKISDDRPAEPLPDVP